MKFRKKPVVIEAVQWDGYGSDGAPKRPWPPDWNTDRWHRAQTWFPGTVSHAVIIPTLEGEMRAEVGDWIIRGVKGEFYPRKPDIFAATYESAEEETRAAPKEALPGEPK